MLWGTVNRRIFGYFAPAMSFFALWVDAIAISMFDWPLHTHTSPMATSFTSTVLFPVKVSLYPVPGFCLSKREDQFPSLSALVLIATPGPSLERVTVTDSSGAA